MPSQHRNDPLVMVQDVASIPALNLAPLMLLLLLLLLLKSLLRLS
jgi:hypothetical protein